MPTVTVTKKGKRYFAQYSQLPGRSFGPFSFEEMVRDLFIAALLPMPAARALVLSASSGAPASSPTG